MNYINCKAFNQNQVNNYDNSILINKNGFLNF